MKNILIILILAIGLAACENSDVKFDDFLYTTGYFPYQYPVRTIILGDDIFPNENDNNHKFLISVAMGGVYKNTQNRVFNIELASDLCQNIRFSENGDTIRLMPQSYYALASNQITIPPGKVNAGVEVQLNDAFFNDIQSTKLWYVIPVRIVNAVNIDTILQGKRAKNNPDFRVKEDWEVQPKNFTMFAVKYINPYHGKYLHRGESIVKDLASTVIETTKYSALYVEKNEIWSLTTLNINSVEVSGFFKSDVISGSFTLNLTIDNNGACNVTSGSGSPYTITGTGKYIENADSWGGSTHHAIYMSYQINTGDYIYTATDTLSVRDRGVVMEVYNPVVFTP